MDTAASLVYSCIMQKSKPKNKQEQLTDAKEAIKKSIGRHEGQLDVKEDPKIAIEVLDDEIKGYRPIEQALVAEHIFRKTIEESIGVGIAGFDVNWKQIYVNRLFCDMVGWSADELINAPFPQPYLIQTSNASNARHLIDRIDPLISSARGIEYRFQRKNGTHFWALIHSNVLSDSEGESIGQLISVADIDDLKTAEDALRRLSTKLIDAQEQERRLVAQDLHDSIGGRLAGIKYGLERIAAHKDANSKETFSMLNDLIDVVRSALEETQRITKKLHPSIVDDLGLQAAVRGYCREFQQLYPHIAVDLKQELNETNLPDSLKILTYRVLQEALNNTAKHSDAENVSVSLRHHADRLELSVVDDGKGFDRTSLSSTNRSTSGMGLQGMRERAELFGGTFRLDSGIGHGTKIRVAWPIDPQRPFL
jgi:PAS domain S-box-containing protein